MIRVIDFETTGTAPPAQVVEVGYCDLDVEDGAWRVREPVSWLCGVEGIPPETRAVHHITIAEVAGLPSFQEASLYKFGTVMAAHNMAFEEQWLPGMIEHRLCTYKAALRVWPEAPGHSNGVLRYWLEDHGLLSLDPALAQPAHRAGPDAYVTAHILKALLEAGATGRDMVAWTREPAVLPTCPIGKFRGKPWAEVEEGFLRWMTQQATMEADLKWNAQREIDRRAAA
ncbi:MAG: hypothetical protein KAX54_00080 [Thauera sp.]|nr:hypothetical protein [Thauera sp.]